MNDSVTGCRDWTSTVVDAATRRPEVWCTHRLVVGRKWQWRDGLPRRVDQTTTVYACRVNRSTLLDEWLIDIEGTVWCRTTAVPDPDLGLLRNYWKPMPLGDLDAGVLGAVHEMLI